MVTNKPDSFERRIAELERRLHNLETAAPSSRTAIGSGGIRVRDGGSIRSEDFDGDGLDEPGEHGWWLGSEGLVVNRAVIRTGQEVVIASDQIETEPVLPSLTTSETVLASVGLTVPDWATSALVIATGTVSCNMTAFGPGETNTMLARVRVAGVDSEWARQSLSATAEASLPAGSVTAVLGRTIASPAGTLTCQLRAEATGIGGNPVVVAGGATVLGDVLRLTAPPAAARYGAASPTMGAGCRRAAACNSG